jgi:fucose permease
MVADRGPVTSAVTIIMIVLATVFVTARFFTRIFLVRSIKQDDWWILAAWVAAVGFSVSICVGVKYGLGLHTTDIATNADHVALRKAEYAFSVLYNPSLMLTKSSIVIFYLSVMSRDVDPVFKWCNWLTLAVTNIAGLALTFLNIFQCTPVRSVFLYPTPKSANCTDIVNLYLSSAPVNIITDLAILFLPMPILTGMRLPKKQKIILVVTFSCGAFVAVVDVIRIAYFQNAASSILDVTTTGSIVTKEQDDFSWYASLSFMWSAVEVNLGIVCACVPSLKPLFLRFIPTFVKDAGTSPGESTTDGADENGPQMAPAMAVKGNISMVNNPAAFRKPTVKEYSGDDSGDEMGFLNFLAGPAEDAPQDTLRRQTTTLSRMSTSRSSTTSDFGFVTMDQTKNMLKLSNSQSIWPIAVVTVIFFLWGFAYGLLDTLNSQFQAIAKISGLESVGLHGAYFGGYLVGPLTLGQFMLKKYGFKAAMMAGLCVYGCGTLIFWPSAVLTSYTAFVISNFIVAFGLSCLEIAANPYIALCGPLEYAEARLNFSQGFQAIGTVLSPLLATKVLFKNINSGPSLIDVQWAYLGIALFVIALAVAFYYIPLPEASDEQLEAMADRRSAAYRARIGPYRVIWITLILGVFSQWCYVGGQEVIGGTTEALYTYFRPNPKQLTPFDYQTISHTVFMAGRFLSAFLNYVFTPRWILLGLYCGLIITCALQMAVSGTAALVVNQLIYLFESGAFSIIFAITLRGMGAHTKTASAYMTTAISGGVALPFIQWVTQNHHTLKFSFIVPLAIFAFGAIFPVYLNLVPAAKNQVQPTHENRNQRRADRANRRMQRTESLASDPNGAARQFGLAGIIARRKKIKAQQAVGTAQHIEQQNQSFEPGVKNPISFSSSTWSDEKLGIGPTEPAPILMRGPSGVVGDLKAWPSDAGESSGSPEKSNEKSEQLEDMITRHRPVWDEKGPVEDEVDYHMFLRGLK